MNKFAANAVKALAALGLGLALTSTVQAATSDEAIIERIKPVGEVCIQGDESCGGAAAAATASTGGARSGEEIYNGKCAACHGSGVLGAPKFGTSEMADRLAEKGLDTLLSNALNGINSMPPRGTCADCSDDEIKSAIEYMANGG
ncbi:c-type cytochrome [Marinobacterium sp. D7]|uniref:c-type cytochrome n=1 Tax=Marinobacterium ramblicola TaxID=2849041 RepID=UPI001C2D803A|nr:c-type cytochrome [Marinobacterium ramblicola]